MSVHLGIRGFCRPNEVQRVPRLNIMSEIINQQQSAILEHLVTSEATTNAEIYPAIGLKQWTYEIQMTDLRERALVSWTRCGRNPQLHFAITATGVKALSDYKARSQITPSAKINLMKREKYKPKQSTYYRNNGNTHIPSLGAFR